MSFEHTFNKFQIYELTNMREIDDNRFTWFSDDLIPIHYCFIIEYIISKLQSSLASTKLSL